MSIHQKNSNWYVIISYKDAFGKFKKKWYKSGPIASDKDGKKALQLEIKLLLDLERGNITLSEKSTVKEFLAKWLDLEINLTKKPRTAYTYKKKMDNISKDIGHITISKLTAIQIKEHINSELKRGLKPNSINAEMTVFKQAMKKAVQWQIITKNPCEFVDLPKRNEPKSSIYSSEQVEKFFAIIRDTDLYLPCMLGFMCGLRRGEICGLRWQDIDLDNKVAIIAHSYNRNPFTGKMELQEVKTSASKSRIPLPNVVISALTLEQLKQKKDRLKYKTAYQESGHVWAQKTGQPHQPDHFYIKFRKILTAHNLPVIRPHDMRHTFATLLYESGLDDKAVSGAVRHSKASFTSDYYVHLREQVKRKPADAINDLFTRLLDNC
ncbi:MAG: phage integrase family protein [Firmicutes bacterium]|nr:phage integrase family protein [Bacillota bacterium]